MTVKELAAKTGKSETAIRAKLKTMNVKKADKGRYIITAEICQEILSAYGISQEKETDNGNAAKDTLAILAEQLKKKDLQIQSLQSQLETALKLLDQQQQLTAARLPLFKRRQRKQIT